MTVTFVVTDTLIEAPLSTPLNPATNTTDFPTGTYFEIRARGSNNVFLACHCLGEDGTQIHLWPRPSGGSELRAAVSIFLRLYRILATNLCKRFPGFFHRQNWSTLPWQRFECRCRR